MLHFSFRVPSIRSMHKWNRKKTRLWITVFFVLLFCLLIFSGNFRCYTKLITGIPCPGCGMTRAYSSLFHLQIKEAFFYHPLFLLPPVVLLLLLLQKKKLFTTPRWLWGIILIVFLGVYAIRMYLYFPDTAPMTYEPNAVLPRLALFFGKIFALLSGH